MDAASPPRWPRRAGHDDAAGQHLGSEERTSDASRIEDLIVSFRFPPYQSVGGVSVGKTAVLGRERPRRARGNGPRPARAADVARWTRIDRSSVVSTRGLDPSSWQRIVSGGPVASPRPASRHRAGSASGIGSGYAYRSLMVPDAELGWGWPAFRAGRRMTNEVVPGRDLRVRTTVHSALRRSMVLASVPGSRGWRVCHLVRLSPSRQAPRSARSASSNSRS